MKKYIALFLALVLTVGILTGCGPKVEEPTESTTESTQATTSAPTEENAEESAGVNVPLELPELILNGTPGYGMNDATVYNHYTVETASPTDSNMTAVLAVAGEEQTPIFENRHLQIAYWTEYLNFMGSYGSYASMMGMDTTKPLWAQEIDQGKTWEQYFLEFAVQGLERNYAMAQYAAANNITLSQEDRTALDEILKTDGGSFYEEYSSQGFADADTYIRYYFGEGTDAKSYREYYEMYLLAATAYRAKQEEINAALTEERILAYYEENKDTFEAQGKKQVNNINVRHILIQPEGEQADWTDADWAAAEASAQAIYDEWLKEPTEEKFSALAIDKTMDPGSAETGGLYEEVAPGDMVAEFNDWCFDPARQVGDHGIVKTTYGYHIMYFVGQTETRAWYDAAAEKLLYEDLQAFMDACQKEYPLAVDYSLARIYDVATANAAEAVG